MLMTIDVGNTNITVGIFDKQKLVGNFRLTTGMTRTSDEFGTAIGEILRYNDIEKQRCHHCQRSAKDHALPDQRHHQVF